MLSDDDKAKLAKALSDKIKSFRCPMCNNHSFTIVDGYLVQNLQSNMNGIVLGNGPMIPSVAIVCTNCGFMSQHNLGVLGMLKRDI